MVQGRPLKSLKTLAPNAEVQSVYLPQSKQVSVFEDENLFQLQGLSPDNDWVKLVQLIPLVELERRYGLSMVIERLQEASEVCIHTNILAANLWKHLREIHFALIQRMLRRRWFWLKDRVH